jgi:DNA-binding LacI/PurR family transcriptional regulator
MADQHDHKSGLSGRSAISRRCTRLIDVAAAVGVSRQVAAKVLHGSGGCNTRVSEETALSVRKAAARLGYRPNLIARQLSGQRSRMLALLRCHGGPPASAQRAFLMEDAAHRSGWGMVIGNAHGNIERAGSFINDFIDRGVEGLICTGFSPQGAVQAHRMIGDAFPVVFQSAYAPTQEPLARASFVTLDRYAAYRQVVRHLLDLGKRRIALALGGGNLDHPSRTEPRRGYVSALREAGISPRKALFWEGFEFADLLDEFIPEQQPDAVLCLTDAWAAPLRRHLTARGVSVPQDIAIVGFENSWDRCCG